MLHRADPEMTETVKRTFQPYVVLQGNVAAFVAARDHLNVFGYDGGLVPDPHGLVTAGHENKTARTIAFREGDVVPEGRCWSSSVASSPTTAPVGGAGSRTGPREG